MKMSGFTPLAGICGLWFILVLPQVEPLLAQPGFKPSDVVTYTDCRRVWSGDVAWREVFFATDGGVWRISRSEGTPLEPWYTGIGYDRAVNLSGARAVLWHKNSNTLWVACRSGLYYCRLDGLRWYQLKGVNFGSIRALGENWDQVVVESDGGDLTAVDPFSLQAIGAADTAGVEMRWVGARGREPHRFPSYALSDPRLDFDPGDGTVTDRNFDHFKPNYDFRDEDEGREYICYPGLGIAVADLRSLRMTIYQPGPAKNDVEAIALDDEGRIWIGGVEETRNGGFSRFDRGSGEWTRFDRTLEFGMESDHAREALFYNGVIYWGTEAGLVYLQSPNYSWRCLDGFDGLSSPDIRTLAVTGGYLIAGSDRGIDFIQTNTNVVWNAGDARLDGLHTESLAVQGDTIWAAGVQGVFKGTLEGRWERISGDSTIGDEPARAITVDERFVWIGSSSGIRQLDRRTGAWTAHLGDVFLKGGKPTALVSNDSLLWVGTNNRGVFRFNRLRGSWLNFGLDQGLPDPRIQRLVLEQDSLWIGSPAGLTRLLWNRPERDGW